MDDDKVMVSIGDAMSAITRAVQWVGEGEDPDVAVTEAGDWLRLQLELPD